MFVHSIAVDQDHYERLMEFVAQLEEKEVIGHGFGHNNSKVYIIYSTHDLSKLIRNSGFTFMARQI